MPSTLATSLILTKRVTTGVRAKPSLIKPLSARKWRLWMYSAPPVAPAAIVTAVPSTWPTTFSLSTRFTDAVSARNGFQPWIADLGSIGFGLSTWTISVGVPDPAAGAWARADDAASIPATANDKQTKTFMSSYFLAGGGDDSAAAGAAGRAADCW